MREHSTDQDALDTSAIIEEVNAHLSAMSGGSPEADAQLVSEALAEAGPKVKEAFDRLCQAAGIAEAVAEESVEAKDIPQSVVEALAQIRQLLIQAREKALEERRRPVDGAIC